MQDPRRQTCWYTSLIQLEDRSCLPATRTRMMTAPSMGHGCLRLHVAQVTSCPLFDLRWGTLGTRGTVMGGIQPAETLPQRLLQCVLGHVHTQETPSQVTECRKSGSSPDSASGNSVTWKVTLPPNLSFLGGGQVGCKLQRHHKPWNFVL